MQTHDTQQIGSVQNTVAAGRVLMYVFVLWDWEKEQNKKDTQQGCAKFRNGSLLVHSIGHT